MFIVDRDPKIEVLDDDECRHLLTTAAMGRLVFTESALPAIEPVHFAVVNGRIVVPCQVGGRIAAACRGAVVALAVDSYDQMRRTGWNVTVIGTSGLVTDPTELSLLDDLHLPPHSPARRRCYVAVDMGVVRGTRLGLACDHTHSGNA